MTILVTGGAGFIGSNFILEWLKHSDETVINLDRLTYAGNLENLASISGNKSHFFVEGDIGDASLTGRIFSDHRPRAVINFAAESHVDRSIDGPAAFIQTNIVSTFNLIEAARLYWADNKDSDFRFLHVSTDEVYGSLQPEESAFTEENQYKPNSPYSASKAASDHLVRASYHTYGLPVLTTNCSNNYGPYQFPEKLIPLMIQRAMTGGVLPVYGDGLNIRDWLYVTDHCSAIRTVLEKGRIGETYNIGGNTEKTNIEIVNTICDILDQAAPKKDGTSYKSQITYVKDRLGHDRRYAINSSKIKNELGWTPSQTFETGIVDTVNWYLNNQEWVDNIKSGAYKSERT